MHTENNPTELRTQSKGSRRVHGRAGKTSLDTQLFTSPCHSLLRWKTLIKLLEEIRDFNLFSCINTACQKDSRHPGAAFPNAQQGSSHFWQSWEPPKSVKTNLLQLLLPQVLECSKDSPDDATGGSSLQCSLSPQPFCCGAEAAKVFA